MWFLQMAQLSTTISQAHRATAFHCEEKDKRQCTLLVVSFTLTHTLQDFLLQPLLLPPGPQGPPGARGFSCDIFLLVTLEDNCELYVCSPILQKFSKYRKE